jgi:hypothetical protein
MTHKQFNEYQHDLLNKVVGMGDTKGKEYANSESRFANFDRAADELGLTNIQVAWVYVKKHLDGIASFCRTQKEFSEPIEGRIVDAIVYLTLIAGMIAEKEEDENGKDREAEKQPKGVKLFARYDENDKDKNVGKHQPFEYDPTKTTE